VSAFFSKATAAVFVEFTESAAHIVGADRSLEIAIEREASGALKPTAADSVRDALKLFAKHPGHEQAICLLPARGISIRRITLPANSSEEIERLLPLQIDAQFPLSSEELAWGYRPLIASAPSRGGATLKELLVAAAKKDSLQQYREIISSAGFEPLFSIAALSREGICPARPDRFGVLEVGSSNSELITYDESGPATLRVLGLGTESNSADPLLNALRSNGAVEKIFVSGKSSQTWSARIAPNIPAESIPVAAGQSAAISGLREGLRRGVEPLLLHANREAVRVERAPAQWRWAAAVCVLLLVSLALRYIDPIVRRARLSATIAQLEDRRAKLPKIDREAGFLNFVHTNQPNYLEVISALGGSVQPGLKLDSLTISRRGELSFRGTAQGAQAATTIRSKMIESGFFANVVIDEQTPGQNQQVSFRMTAQVRAEPDRKAGVAKVGDKNSSTNKVSATPSAPVEMPGPPPGMIMDAPPPAEMMSPPPGAVPPPVRLPPGVSLPPGVVVTSEGAPQ
jgi:hypothetical protein